MTGARLRIEDSIMTDEELVESSGNVFADLGIAAPEAHLLKAGLVAKLADVIRGRALNQTAAAKLTGISQPDLSRILRGRFRDISSERLMRALTNLDSEIEITVRREGRIVGDPIHLHAHAPA
jgi:predicted XRE-type DNA-binding protein